MSQLGRCLTTAASQRQASRLLRVGLCGAGSGRHVSGTDASSLGPGSDWLLAESPRRRVLGEKGDAERVDIFGGNAWSAPRTRESTISAAAACIERQHVASSVTPSSPAMSSPKMSLSKRLRLAGGLTSDSAGSIGSLTAAWAAVKREPQGCESHAPQILERKMARPACN